MPKAKQFVVCDPNFLPFFFFSEHNKAQDNSPHPHPPRQTETICLYWPSPQAGPSALGGLAEGVRGLAKGGTPRLGCWGLRELLRLVEGGSHRPAQRTRQADGVPGSPHLSLSSAPGPTPSHGPMGWPGSAHHPPARPAWHPLLPAPPCPSPLGVVYPCPALHGHHGGGHVLCPGGGRPGRPVSAEWQVRPWGSQPRPGESEAGLLPRPSRAGHRLDPRSGGLQDAGALARGRE